MAGQGGAGRGPPAGSGPRRGRRPGAPGCGRPRCAALPPCRDRDGAVLLAGKTGRRRAAWDTFLRIVFCASSICLKKARLSSDMVSMSADMVSMLALIRPSLSPMRLSRSSMRRPRASICSPICLPSPTSPSRMMSRVRLPSSRTASLRLPAMSTVVKDVMRPTHPTIVKAAPSRTKLGEPSALRARYCKPCRSGARRRRSGGVWRASAASRRGPLH